MDIHVGVSKICSAMKPMTVGSKVINEKGFWKEVYNKIRETDFNSQEIPGQVVVDCPAAIRHVSSGVGKKPANEWMLANPGGNYVLREHRGDVHRYLKRCFAAPVESCQLVLYTFAAYKLDPEVDPNEFAGNHPTHVLVAVIAAAGPKAPLPPGRLVSNLAGGNRAALTWDADTIRKKCMETNEYWSTWCTVAD